jgi:hypothetical protein
MYVSYGNNDGGGGGGGFLPERRGTRLAAELDRRLASDEPLYGIVDWCIEAWCARVRVYLAFPNGGGEGDVQPKYSLTLNT